MNKSLLFFITLLIMITHHGSMAQTTPGTQREKDITARYSNYFKADREKIYLHLNKTTYLNEETIWFKGYVIEEKNKKPFTALTNAYIDLYDPNGTRIQSELCYLANGSFEGYIPLSKMIKSGRYYIRAYTGFMNNFAEDESALYPVTILDPMDKTTSFTNNKPNLSNLNVQFFPESGVFLENNSNVIALKISDCNDIPIAIQNGSIVNAKGDVVTHFSTNAKGVGRFELPQNNNAPYKAVFKSNNDIQSFTLPTPKNTGYTFSINNYRFDKAIVSLKTAQPVTSQTNLSLLIQQDEKVSLIENLSLKAGVKEDTFTIDNKHFYEGINTIVLLDQNNIKLAERLIFQPYSANRNIMLSVVQKQKDTIILKGTSNFPLGNLSISVVPEKSVATGNFISINDAFVFASYLENPMITNTAYYFSDFSKNKHYELDTYLITQKPKYDAEKILNSTEPMVPKYEPDRGVTIKGTINRPLSKKSNYYVEMSSFYNSVKKQSEINDSNEFIFNNAIVYDSTSISLTLHNRNTGRTEDVPLAIQILKGQNLFLKPLPKLFSTCPTDPANPIATESYQLPDFRDQKVVQLSNVTLKKKAKTVPLKNVGRYNNSMARGYKISNGDFATFREVLPFIGANGFDVIYKNGSVYINNRISRSLRGNPSPAVFIDDVPLSDLTMLIGMSLDMVEEIYISKSGYGMGMDGGSGYIRIYTKRYMGTETVKSKAQTYVIKKAAQAPKDFKNPDYLNYDDGFANYGTVAWFPVVKTDPNGDFFFFIPDCKQESVRVKIEGIDPDGELISEEKTIRL